MSTKFTIILCAGITEPWIFVPLMMSGMVFICEVSLVMFILPTLRHFIALCRPGSVASRELFGLDALPDRVIRTYALCFFVAARVQDERPC
jgi:hypothetical protein